jgi:hypothetical protein
LAVSLIFSLASSKPNCLDKPPRPNLSKAFPIPSTAAPPNPKALSIFLTSLRVLLSVRFKDLTASSVPSIMAWLLLRAAFMSVNLFSILLYSINFLRRS